MKRMLMIGVAALFAMHVGIAHASLTSVSSIASSPVSFDLGADTTWTSPEDDASTDGSTLSVSLTSQPVSNQVYFVGFIGGYQVSIVGSDISYFGFSNPGSPSGDQGSNPTIASVPVPGAFLLGIAGLVAIAARKRR